MKHVKKYLYRELKTHSFQYMVLGTAFIMMLILVSLLRGYRSAQYTILLFGIIFYIAWGITHHSSEKTLKLEIVVEYILIGGTVLFLITMLLN